MLLVQNLVMLGRAGDRVEVSDEPATVPPNDLPPGGSDLDTSGDDATDTGVNLNAAGLEQT